MCIELPATLELVPHLGVLDKLIRAKTPDMEQPKVNRHCEQLPYYLRGACYALHNLELARIQASEQFSIISGGDLNAQWVIGGDLWDIIGFHTDSYLASLRRSFDALVHYFSLCPNHNDLPESFHKLIAGIEGGKYEIDSEIQKLARVFWDNSGSKVKGYRDQAVHKAVIVSNCLMFYHPVAGSVGMRMYLPDDPFEKSPVKLTYDAGIHAMIFFTSSLYSTIEFVNAAVERMIELLAPDDPNVRDSSIVTISFRGGSINIPEREGDGDPVPYSVTVQTIVKRAVQQRESS